MLFDITHTTHYRYAQPVELGTHRVMFRPRGSHDMRVLATSLEITPEPKDVRLIHDVYSNSIAIVEPTSPTTELKFVCKFTVEHVGERVLDLPVEPAFVEYPFVYSDEDTIVLQPYLLPFYTDPTGELLTWTQSFLTSDSRVYSLDVLVRMNAFIRDTMQYLPRISEGVQSPYETLHLGSGTCRDFATLMIEAVRTLGYAARFVSGYLYTPALDSADGAHHGAGATHAWVQVYLPGAGWLTFDPTNNLVGGTDLIRVGFARHASGASPITGNWHGFPGDFLGMEVDVQVSRRSD
jgi:transglutaminase-like putative cysteine protease